MNRKAAHNSTYPKVAVHWLNQAFQIIGTSCTSTDDYLASIPSYGDGVLIHCGGILEKEAGTDLRRPARIRRFTLRIRGFFSEKYPVVGVSS